MTGVRDEDLGRDLWADSPVEKVVRGHLWIEFGLIQLIEATLPFPDQVDLGRFSFAQKLALAIGHGFIRPDEAPAYRRFNAIRNKVAHDLNRPLTEQDLADLVNSLSPRMRSIYEAHLLKAYEADAHWSQRFSLVIMHLYLRLESEHGRVKEHQARMAQTNRAMRESEEKLRTLLKENPRVRQVWEELGGPSID